MLNPWHILGLDPDSATEKEVKSAYAKLIKQHRPDADPEGFQRVRQAYEAALAMLKNPPQRQEDESQTEPLFDDNQPVLAEPAPPISQPPALIEAELAVSHAREADDRTAIAKAIGDLYAICRGLRPGRAGLMLWQETLHRVTDGRSMLVALGVTIPQMLDEMEASSAVITHAVIGHWEGERDIDSLARLSAAILAEAARLSHHEASIVALRIALEIAFARPALASSLVNFAFPHLDREAREQVIPQVEQQAALGKLMPGLRTDQEAFWHKRFRRPRFDWDWTDADSQAAMDYLATSRGKHWEGYALIKQLAPAEWFQQLEKEVGKKQGGLMGRFRTTRLGNPRPQSQGAGRSSWKRFTWIIFIVLINLARLLPNCEGPNKPAGGTAVSNSAAVPAFLSAPVRTFNKGPAAAEARAKQLRQQHPNLIPWIEQNNDLSASLKGKFVQPEGQTIQDALKPLRLQMLKFYDSVHVGIGGIDNETRFLELVLMDRTTSTMAKSVAVERMVNKGLLSSSLPIWQMTAQASSEEAMIIANAADWMLKNKAADLTDNERAALVALQKR